MVDSQHLILSSARLEGQATNTVLVSTLRDAARGRSSG